MADVTEDGVFGDGLTTGEPAACGGKRRPVRRVDDLEVAGVEALLAGASERRPVVAHHVGEPGAIQVGGGCERQAPLDHGGEAPFRARLVGPPGDRVDVGLGDGMVSDEPHVESARSGETGDVFDELGGEPLGVEEHDVGDAVRKEPSVEDLPVLVVVASVAGDVLALAEPFEEPPAELVAPPSRLGGYGGDDDPGVGVVRPADGAGTGRVVVDDDGVQRPAATLRCRGAWRAGRLR